uniref:Uncharacterized protein n=1 Tax=viral metagenome TaxID=1070528 RepID=A0A6M3IKY0_9ZZZZ
MPVAVKKIGGKYRIVEKATGRIAKTDKGNPVDGGGHLNRIKAGTQAGRINSGIKKKQDSKR